MRIPLAVEDLTRRFIIYQILAMWAQQLPAPESRTYKYGIINLDFPGGQSRRFQKLAKNLPGAWHRGHGNYYVPLAILRMLDPARAETAWRTPQ